MEKVIFHELPFFSGTQNIVDWIDTVERAGSFAKWNDDEIRRVARLRIRGEASEYIGHLELEEKANTWTSLKKVLKDRYDSKGQEQLNQYLLSTSQQGEKTVQEWAQVVRKLSIKSLSDLDREPNLQTERYGATAAGDQAAADDRGADCERAGEKDQPKGSRDTSVTDLAMKNAAGQEHTEEMNRLRKRKERLLLDYTRRVNFVRGLKPDLRRAVLQRGCITFDEAVEAAQREENLNIAVGQEELLNSMCVQQDSQKNSGVNEVAVALAQLLEERDKNKSMTHRNLGLGTMHGQGEHLNALAAQQETPRGVEAHEVAVAVVQLLDQRERENSMTYGDRRSAQVLDKTIPLPEATRYRDNRGSPHNSAAHQREMNRNGYSRPNYGRQFHRDDQNGFSGMDSNQHVSDAEPGYRGEFQQHRRDASRGPMPRTGRQNRANYYPRSNLQEFYQQRRDDIDRKACFFCHQRGHVIRDCEVRLAANDEPRQGNGFSRF